MLLSLTKSPFLEMTSNARLASMATTKAEPKFLIACKILSFAVKIACAQDAFCLKPNWWSIPLCQSFKICLNRSSCLNRLKLKNQNLQFFYFLVMFHQYTILN